jgi:hypothetical protein
LPIDDCRLPIEKEWRMALLSIGNLQSKIGNPYDCRLPIEKAVGRILSLSIGNPQSKVGNSSYPVRGNLSGG